MNDKDDSDVDPISERIIGNIFDYIYNVFYNGHFFAVQFRLISRHRDNGRFIDMETCNESISSLFDDSSHSESNTKEECCDGDDELTDVEGGNEWKL